MTFIVFTVVSFIVSLTRVPSLIPLGQSKMIMTTIDPYMTLDHSDNRVILDLSNKDVLWHERNTLEHPAHVLQNWLWDDEYYFWGAFESHSLNYHDYIQPKCSPSIDVGTLGKLLKKLNTKEGGEGAERGQAVFLSIWHETVQRHESTEILLMQYVWDFT